MRKILFILFVFNLSSCAELQGVIDQLPQGGGITNLEIGSGLREALDFGIDKQVTKLTQKGGFYNNALVKIVMPQELQKVDKALRDIGLGKLADQGIRALNRAADSYFRIGCKRHYFCRC
jgi:hypothetical protein